MDRMRSKVPTRVGLAFAGIHLVSCAVVFGFFLSSSDSEAALVFVVLLPLDPWLPILTHSIESTALLASLAALLGTAQWFAAGWIGAHVVRWCVE
jgi:hypothetical protein